MNSNSRVPKSPKKKKKQRSYSERCALVALWFLIAAIALGGLGFLFNHLYEKRLIEQEKTKKNPETSVTVSENAAFKLRSIEVKGNEHYTVEQIIAASGLKIGQNSISIHSTEVSAKIKAACPYVESVKVTTSLNRNATITVKETSIIGAVYHDGNWLLVGENGQAVDQLKVTGNLPSRYLYFKGAETTGLGLGKQAMDDRCTAIMKSYFAAAKSNKLDGVCEFDFTDKSDLTLNWKNQIRIQLGDDTEMDYKISVVTELLPRILEKHGKQAKGSLDVSCYSEGAVNKGVVFTPDD